MVFLFWQCFVFEKQPRTPERAPVLNWEALGAVLREPGWDQRVPVALRAERRSGLLV